MSDYGPVGPGYMTITLPASLTLRDYFAAAALTGLLRRSKALKHMEPSDWAGDAYGIADAMLVTRGEK